MTSTPGKLQASRCTRCKSICIWVPGKGWICAVCKQEVSE